MEFAKLKSRYEESKQYKDRWIALYKELYFYVIPNRNAFNVKWNYQDDGLPATAQVWDDTAVLASYQRTNDLNALLLPKDRVWGKFALDPHIFQQQTIDALQPTIDEVNDRILFYISQSNLASTISSSTLDLVGGTAALWVESISDHEPLCFRPISAVTLVIEYTSNTTVENCWYQCKMLGRQVLDTFPDYNGRCKEALVGTPDDHFVVVYGQIKLDEDSYYIYATLEIDMFEPLFEVERSYPQIIVYRDKVRPGESDGRGVGIDLLPTIRDSNRLLEYSRKNMAFKAYPPMFYDANSYLNPYSIRQWAGAMIQRQPQGRNPVEAMQMPEYPDVLEHIKYMQDVIRLGFQVDPLGEINSTVRSATEVSIRENRAQRTSATDISRLINEFPRKVFEVSARILHERKLLTRDRAMSKFNPKQLRFDFQSPLYDLQKQDDLTHFTMNMQIKQQYFGQGATIATVNLPEVNKFLTEKLNLPHKLFVTDDQLKEFLKSFNEMQQNAALPQPQASASQVALPQQSQVNI